MKGELNERIAERKEYNFVSFADKEFIVAFDDEMNNLGYSCNKTISDSICRGRNMIIYTKAGVKSKKSYARIYMRENGIVLRMYFSNVDKNRQLIEAAHGYIQQAFTGDYGACKHCRNTKEDGSCSHRKIYTLHDKRYEFCDGYAFWFFSPSTERIPEYIKLFLSFYPERKRK